PGRPPPRPVRPVAASRPARGRVWRRVRCWVGRCPGAGFGAAMVSKGIAGRGYPLPVLRLRFLYSYPLLCCLDIGSLLPELYHQLDEIFDVVALRLPATTGSWLDNPPAIGEASAERLELTRLAGRDEDMTLRKVLLAAAAGAAMA